MGRNAEILYNPPSSKATTLCKKKIELKNQPHNESNETIKMRID